MRKELGLILTYATLMVTRVAGLVTGGVIAAGIAIYEQYFNRGISKDSVLWGIAAYFVLAGYLAWKEEHQSAKGPTTRIALFDLLKRAESLGVDFMGESPAILDICRKLQQEGSEGNIQFWGTSRRNSGPYLQIPKNHWCEYEIDWTKMFVMGPPSGHIKGFSPDSDSPNLFVTSMTHIGAANKPHAYWDLHLTESEASAWLDHYVASMK